MPGLDVSRRGVTARHHEQRPPRSTSRMRTRGDLRDVWFGPNRDLDFDRKAVAECAPLRGHPSQIEQDVHALFVHPERGRLREGCGFYAALYSCG
jgi:hypothetical protein